MLAVVTREEVMESMIDRIIENINSNLLLCGKAGYVIERSECDNREIAIKIGKEIAELYRRKGYNVGIYEYGMSNRESFIGIYISL